MRSVILLVFFSVSLQTSSYQILTRRLWLRTTAPTLITPFLAPISANAIDPSLLRTFPIEGDTSGSASRLANLAAIQQSKIDTDPELVDVIEGVQTREYKKGDGPQASDGSRVGVEMTVRCSTVTSTTEPNGAMIFSTSRDDDLGELIFRIGKGDIPASLEKSIKGMSRGGIKRIYLSSERAYEWKNSGTLPLPKGDREKRIAERVFKGKANLVVEVKVARVRGGEKVAAEAAEAAVGRTGAEVAAAAGETLSSKS